MKRTITELIDLKTGIHHIADEILAQPERKIISLRRDLAERAKLHRNGIKDVVFLACSICTQPVRLAGMPTGEFYFKHDNDSGDCPIKTSGKYSQKEIDTMRYNGAKESSLHRELKYFIANMLKQDARFSDIEVEKTIKSKGFSKSWKRPDVSSTFNNGPGIVFEIQLSTTFLNVIIDRENFYKDEQTYIMWLFNSFSLDGIRFTEKDIYNANKCNAFVISDETRRLSHERGELILICHYKKPCIHNNKITYQWINQEVTISDLKFDSDNYKIYYYDFDAEETKLIATLKSVTEWNEFEIYWLRRNNIPDNERWQMERTWYRKFKDKDLIPAEAMDFVGFPEEIKQIFNALYSVKHKQMINYKYQPNAWLQVSNLILNSRKEFAGLYCRALKVHGLFSEVIKLDKKHTFQNKYKIILDGVNSNDPAYEQNFVYRPLLNALFPELYLDAVST